MDSSPIGVTYSERTFPGGRRTRGLCFRTLFPDSVSGLCFRTLFPDSVSGLSVFIPIRERRRSDRPCELLCSHGHFPYSRSIYRVRLHATEHTLYPAIHLAVTAAHHKQCDS